MVNTGLTGKVVDSSGRGISGLFIKAIDLDPVNRDDVLGVTTTMNDGRYSLSYLPAAYQGLLDSHPDIVIIVLDCRGIREVSRTQEFVDVQDNIFQVPDIIVAGLPCGWFTSRGSDPTSMSSGNMFSMLVDGETTFRQMTQSVENARSSIHLLQLWIDNSFVSWWSQTSSLGTPMHEPLTTFVNALLRANQRGVVVRILLNLQPVAPDTFDEVVDFFRNAGNNSVIVRPFWTAIGYVMHAKSMVVDNREAFVFGPPFTQVYWDTPGHPLHDIRRDVGGSSGGSVGSGGSGSAGSGTGSPTGPIHDVSVRIMGPAVMDVQQNFIELWNFVANREHQGQESIDPTLFSNPTGFDGGELVQIIRSIPRDILPGLKDGEKGILEGYLRAIARSVDYIYIENQYFLNKEILRAIKISIDLDDKLEAIIVLNNNPDLPGYHAAQVNNLQENGFLSHPRIGLFSLWNMDMRFHPGNTIGELKQCYVHSKSAFIDDKWATIGTANLDGYSLTEGHYMLTSGRNVELNAVVFGRSSDGQIVDRSPLIRNRRVELWTEHLHIVGDTIQVRPAEGWLEIWRKRARENISSINNSTPSMKGHVLPFSKERHPISQLQGLGIEVSRFSLPD